MFLPSDFGQLVQRPYAGDPCTRVSKTLSRREKKRLRRCCRDTSRVVNVDASDTRISSTRQRNPVGSICGVPRWCFTLTSRRASLGLVFARWIFILGKLELMRGLPHVSETRTTHYFIGFVNTSLVRLPNLVPLLYRVMYMGIILRLYTYYYKYSRLCSEERYTRKMIIFTLFVFVQYFIALCYLKHYWSCVYEIFATRFLFL